MPALEPTPVANLGIRVRQKITDFVDKFVVGVVSARLVFVASLEGRAI
jgi:hypothetical protein